MRRYLIVYCPKFVHSFAEYIIDVYSVFITLVLYVVADFLNLVSDSAFSGVFGHLQSALLISRSSRYSPR